MSASKKQVDGVHYKKHKMQPWDIIDEYKLNFYEGNILKYLLREKESRVIDLKKLIQYAETEVEDEIIRTSEGGSPKTAEETEGLSISDPIGGASEWKDFEFFASRDPLQRCTCDHPKERLSGYSFPGHCDRCGYHIDKLSRSAKFK